MTTFALAGRGDMCGVMGYIPCLYVCGCLVRERLTREIPTMGGLMVATIATRKIQQKRGETVTTTRYYRCIISSKIAFLNRDCRLVYASSEVIGHRNYWIASK